MQGDVDLLRLFNKTIRFRYLQPVNIDSHLVKERADLQSILLRTDRHHLMECCLDFNPVPDITCGKSAGKIMLFQNQNVCDASGLKLQGCGQTCKTCAHNNHIIMLFIKLHIYSCLSSCSHADKERGCRNRKHHRNL